MLFIGESAGIVGSSSNKHTHLTQWLLFHWQRG